MATLIKKHKNIWNKTRPLNDPYVEWTDGLWTYRVLKAYQSRIKEKDNEYARLFMAISSPHTYNQWELGDTYIKDLPYSNLLQVAFKKREDAEVIQ